MTLTSHTDAPATTAPLVAGLHHLGLSRTWTPDGIPVELFWAAALK
jgi:hypothetical protein